MPPRYLGVCFWLRFQVIDAVSKPYYSGKRHFFSRKPKVYRAWRRLISELPSPKKRAENYANFMFG